MIEPGDRELAVGMTGSGKSGLLGYHFATYPGQRILIDVNDDYELAPAADELGGAATVSGDDLREALRSARTIRYVPATLEPEEYEQLYRLIWEHARAGVPKYVWLDESEGPTTANRAPLHLRLTIKQGRKKDITHAAATLRPVDIEGAIVNQSEHAFVFRMTDAKDIALLARRLGLSPLDLTAALDQLPEHGFLYHRLGQNVVAFPPLDEQRRALTAQHVVMP